MIKTLYRSSIASFLEDFFKKNQISQKALAFFFPEFLQSDYSPDEEDLRDMFDLGITEADEIEGGEVIGDSDDEESG